MNLETMLKIRGMRHVNRFTQNPTIKPNNVAEHSYFVAVYCDMIMNTVGAFTPELRCMVLKLAMYHDSHEGISVELPHNVKRVISKDLAHEVESRAKVELFGTNEVEGAGAELPHAILKVADLLDAFLYAVEECRMGNTFYDPIIVEVKFALFQYATKLDNIITSTSCSATTRLTTVEFIKELVLHLGYMMPTFSTGNSKSMTHIHTGFRRK